MKRIIPVLLALCLVLCACAAKPEPTEPATQPPATTQPVATTDAPTTQPDATVPSTEPQNAYTNPLTGEAMATPYTGRPIAVTINNVDPALPHHGVNDAAMLFEMLVNDNATRCLAVFSSVEEVPSVGSIRSARFNFVDICQSYDAILAHAGGSEYVMGDVRSSIDYLDAIVGAGASYFYRDESRLSSGYDYEHTLFTNSEMITGYANDKGYDLTVPEGTTYGLNFSENATPDGADASEVSFDFWGKMTYMLYNADTGKYEYREYGMDLVDGNTGAAEAFKNVFVIMTTIYQDGVYHVADLDGSGDGYFACGGKIVPIRWHHEDADAPFTFTLTDGTPLVQGIGNSYFGIVDLDSDVEWE